MKFLMGMLTMLVIMGAVAALVIYTGLPNVAASKAPETKGEQNEGLLEEVLEATMEASVKRQAKNLTAPSLDDPAMRKAGFTHYDAMCVACHGAPGARRAEFSRGLNPHPPSLVTVLDEWSPAELFWITKHGVMMTGMPAFGPTHTDDEIWSIIAFLQSLPDLTPEQYLAMRPRPEDTTASGSDDHHH